MRYIIEGLNGDAEIIDPVVTFPRLINWNPETKIGSVYAILTTPNGSSFGVPLPNLSIPTVNQGTMNAKGSEALKQYEV